MSLMRSLFPSALVGATTGFVVLGIGGRTIMRIIAHWEGRVPVLTPSGTFTVVMIATVAGLAAGVIHGLLRPFVSREPARIAAFFAICVLFTLYGVKEVLPRPKLLFVGITLVYCLVVELVMRRARREDQPPPPRAA